MSNPKGTRRAVAEIRWDNNPGAILWVGNRPVAACWPLIAAYFRDLLLPPHRRAEDESVTWTWNEPVNPPALTASEINSVRRHLQSELQLFLENVAGAARAQGQRGDSNQVDTVQLGATLREWVQQVSARPDAELARYICRTDQGLRLHSWGAPQPSGVRFLDAKGLEIAGHVLVGGMPALHDVLLETGDGEMVAETPSDSLGAFRFPKLTPGKYRLRARSKRGTFPPHGVVVVLNQTSVVDIVLADDGPAAAPTRGRRPARAGKPRGLAIAAVLSVLVAGAGWWTFNRTSEPNTLQPAAVAEAKAQSPGTPAVPAGVSAGANAQPSAGLIESNRPTDQSTVVAQGTARTDTASASDLAKTHESKRAGQRKEASSPGVVAAGSAGGGSSAVAPTGGTAATASGTTSAATMSATTAPTAGTTSSVTASSLTPPPPTLAPQAGASTAAGAVAAATSAHANANPLPSAKSTPPTPTTQPGERAPDTATVANKTNQAAAGAAPVAAADTLERLTGTPADALQTESSSSPAAASARPSPGSADNLAATTPATAASSPEAAKDSLPPSAPAPASRETKVNGVSAPASAAAWRASASRLTRTVRVRLSPWRVRLLEDSILPTQPLRAGQAEPVAALRQRILEEQKAKLPATLTQGEVLSGLRVEVAATDLTDGLAWRDDQGAVIPGSRVEKGRAEITWAAANAPKDRPFRLSGSNGVVLVEARYEAQSRELVVRTAEEVQAWLRWVVRAVPADATRASTEQTESGKPRFVWRTGTGNPVPTGWHATDSADAAADHRVDLPLGSVFGAVAAQSCALLDHATGWALVTETRQAADRPLGL